MKNYIIYIRQLIAVPFLFFGLGLCVIGIFIEGDIKRKMECLMDFCINSK